MYTPKIRTISVGLFLKTLQKVLDLLSLKTPKPKDFAWTSGPWSIFQNIFAEGELRGMTLRAEDQFPVNLCMQGKTWT